VTTALNHNTVKTYMLCKYRFPTEVRQESLANAR